MDILDTYDRHDDCKLDIVHFGVGPVSLSDLELANTFDGIVYAMHVGVLPEARAKMKQSEVKEFKVKRVSAGSSSGGYASNFVLLIVLYRRCDRKTLGRTQM